MSRKKRENPVIDVEVSEATTTATTVAKVKRPRRVNTKNAVAEITAEAEAELNGSTANVPKVINDNGEINVDNIPSKRLAYYNEIASVLNEKDMTSISTYGSDLQNAMDTYSNDFLTQSFASRSSIESAQLISNLLGELHEVNIDDLETPSAWKCFLRKIPGIKKFGIIYNVSEPNSLVQANLAKAEAEKQGLTVIEKTVTEANAIVTTANQVVSEGAEAFYLPTDNLIASNMPAIAQVCEDKKIPAICGEESMVVAGGTITYGVNYFNLGKQTAAQAAKVLLGTNPGVIPVGTQPASELSITVNDEGLANIGLELPQSIKDRIK